MSFDYNEHNNQKYTSPFIPRLTFNKNPSFSDKKTQGYKHIRMKSKLFEDDKSIQPNSSHNIIQQVNNNYKQKILPNNIEQQNFQNLQEKYTPKLTKRPLSSYEGSNKINILNMHANIISNKTLTANAPNHTMQRICSKMAQSIIIGSDDNNDINQEKVMLSQDQFKKIKFLGQGKFGQVHLVKHQPTGFICAMKIIEKSIVREQGIQGQLAKQIRIQNQLNNMNIIQLYGYFDDEKYFYILLEYAIDGSVFSKLKGRSRLEQNEIQPIAKGICDGLRCIHKMEFVHRDIKPENIVLQFGVPKICDFGWATKCDDFQLCKSYCGTPLYISPQMVRKQFYGTSVDIWAIGMIVYQLLVGRVPFRIWTQEDMNEIVTKPIQFPQYIDRSQKCQSFIRKCLQKTTIFRIQLSQALKHPFITQINQGSVKYQFFEQVKNVLNDSH